MKSYFSLNNCPSAFWFFGLSYYFLIQPRTNVMCEGLHYTTRIVWTALKTGLKATGYIEY